MNQASVESKQSPSPGRRALGLRSWKDSAPVRKLSDYIRANRHHGIYLVLRNGHPALDYRPALRQGNSERWDACLAAEVLLFDATDDLMKLIDRQAIRLPESFTGPSRKVDPHGSRQPTSSLLF